MLLDSVRQLPRKARLIARVLYQTGALEGIDWRGAPQAARALLRGATGPSAVFRIHAALHPDRSALVFQGRSYSYHEVDERIDRLAAGMAARGVRRGERALVMLHNCPGSLEINAAMMRLGAGGVAVSWRSTASELAYLANHSEARAIFFDPAFASAVTPLEGQIDRARMITVGDTTLPGYTTIDEVMTAPPRPVGGDEEGQVIIYTSGTTGKPKGAVRSFSTGQAEGFFGFIGETPMHASDRHLAVCPLYHTTGLGFAAMNLLLGATVVIQPEFEPEEFLRLIDREGIHSTAIVPTMLHRLMALPDAVFRKYSRRTLRAVFCAGAQLPPTLAARTLDRLGPVLYNLYGATETGMVTLASPADLRALPGTIGRVVPGTEIRLYDEQGRIVGPGEIGELFAHNSMLVDGYHHDEASTRASMRDGFFSVGDLATVDAQGRYLIVGRRRDMVISGGVNVYPAEVEDAIETHPEVAQVAVIGIPDEEWGERLRAFVVRREGARVTADALRAHCKTTLSGAKVPREWVFLDALPSNPTGKVLKRELRDYRGEIERATA